MVKGGDNTAVKCAGLPNITGTTSHTGTSCITNPAGAFYNVNSSGYRTSSSGGSGIALGFDASRSNSIYGKANTVQAPALSLMPQSKI